MTAHSTAIHPRSVLIRQTPAMHRARYSTRSMIIRVTACSRSDLWPNESYGRLQWGRRIQQYPPQRSMAPSTWVGGTWGLAFFFQAEDGIRDVAVTGVQTCALPI